MPVDFYEEGGRKNVLRQTTDYQRGGVITRIVISSGLARTARGAQMVLITIAVLSLGVAIYIWLEGVHHTASVITPADRAAVTTDLQKR